MYNPVWWIVISACFVGWDYFIDDNFITFPAPAPSPHPCTATSNKEINDDFGSDPVGAGLGVGVGEIIPARCFLDHWTNPFQICRIILLGHA